MQEISVTETRKIWETKKVLRLIYFSWYKQIIANLNSGNVVELSAGCGNFKEYYPNCISCEYVESRWVDLRCDSMHLPFKNNSITNLVLIDALHHYSDIEAFFREAHRVLKPSGRLLMIEPYISPFSYVVRKLFHNEFCSFKHIRSLKNPNDGNLALPTLLFFRKNKMNQQIMSIFNVIKLRRFNYFTYPLSRGFSKKALLNSKLFYLIQTIEKEFSFLSSIFSFKMLVILEKKADRFK